MKNARFCDTPVLLSDGMTNVAAVFVCRQVGLSLSGHLVGFTLAQ